MHENKPSLVTHPRDPRFLTLRSLQTPEARSRTSLYLIEGIRHLAHAVEQHAPIQSVFFDPSVLSNHFGRKLARRLRKSGVPSTQLSLHLYRELTLAAEPQGIGAVLRQQCIPLADLRLSCAARGPSPATDNGKVSAHTPNRFGKGTASAVPKAMKIGTALAAEGLWLAVESIESPGNLGTIILTAEAAGVVGIFLLGQSDDPWDPAAVRASMGSLFSQKLVRCSAREFIDWARSSGVATVGSSPSGLLDYKALRCGRPAVLLIGSEKRGLSGHLIEASDFMVRIPMRGGCDSINVAVAAGILLFEMSSQQQRGK
jgi:TrmH family RNA methyltransferase